MFVTIREAAERLEVSPDTIRRRLKAGELQGRQEPTGGSGYRWLIELPDDAPPEEEPEPAFDAIAFVTAQAQIEELKRLIEDSVAQRDTAIALATAQARLEELERLTAELASERDDWKAQAKQNADALEREQEAAGELRRLLANEQMRDRELPAQVKEAVFEALPRTQEEPAKPSSPATVESSGIWARIRRVFTG